MVKLSDTLSISVQYETMFTQETRVQKALSDLYHETYLFLEKIRATVTRSCEFVSPFERGSLSGHLNL